MGNHIKREHKEREELNSSGLWAQLVSCFCADYEVGGYRVWVGVLWAQLVSCFCQDCSLVGSCSTYDDHGEENHNIPKNMR